MTSTDLTLAKMTMYRCTAQSLCECLSVRLRVRACVCVCVSFTKRSHIITTKPNCCGMHLEHGCWSERERRLGASKGAFFFNARLEHPSLLICIRQRAQWTLIKFVNFRGLDQFCQKLSGVWFSGEHGFTLFSITASWTCKSDILKNTQKFASLQQLPLAVEFLISGKKSSPNTGCFTQTVTKEIKTVSDLYDYIYNRIYMN